jgi:hypothetical protein
LCCHDLLFFPNADDLLVEVLNEPLLALGGLVILQQDALDHRMGSWLDDCQDIGVDSQKGWLGVGWLLSEVVGRDTIEFKELFIRQLFVAVTLKVVEEIAKLQSAVVAGRGVLVRILGFKEVGAVDGDGVPEEDLCAVEDVAQLVVVEEVLPGDEHAVKGLKNLVGLGDDLVVLEGHVGCGEK